MAPLASVVIPAHNEAAVIGRLLTALRSGFAPGELEVVVACNACTDDTAAIAREHGATVVEIEQPSKIAALNAGDAAATAFPRCYVDADVVVSGEVVRAVVDVLAEPGVECAAPPFTVDLTRRPWPIRGFYAVWLRNPHLRDRYVGSGFYAFTRQGRARFDKWPAIIADDLFAKNLFHRDERRTAPTEPMVLQAPWTLRALYRRRLRIYAGNLELAAHPEYGDLPGSREPSYQWWKPVLRDPRLVPGGLVYAAVNGLAKRAARRRLRQRGTVDWGRDDTTRSVPAGA